VIVRSDSELAVLLRLRAESARYPAHIRDQRRILRRDRQIRDPTPYN